MKQNYTNTDGPASPYFKPIQFKGNITWSDLAGHPGITRKMSEGLIHAPREIFTGWGVPFKIQDPILLYQDTLTIPIEPIKARWLVFLHVSDLREKGTDSQQPVHPNRGEGQLNEIAAIYSALYTNGTREDVSIQRRHQVGVFSRRWGENCFQAVSYPKPHPLRTSHEQLRSNWGETQMRVNFLDWRAPWTTWLWAWENPHPDQTITGFRFEPVSGVNLLFAISSGNTSTNPLQWRERRKALLILPQGVTFQPDLDTYGQLEQVRLDLGQVISATPRLDYPNEKWEGTYNNQLPSVSKNEILLEYTSHPQACIHLWDGRILPISGIEAAYPGLRPSSSITAVPSASRKVRLKVLDSASRKPVAVRLHVHGVFGEYLTPIDRHRIMNPSWFEDYSVDSIHQGLHQSTYISGDTEIKLPLGSIYIEVFKGFEIRPLRKIFEVKPDTEELVIDVEKVLAWRERGWVTADTHVHFLSPMSALLEGAGEGVNVINLLASQWGELMTNVGDFDGHTTWGSSEAGGDGEFLVRVGTENRQQILGHISLLGYQGRIIAPMTCGGPDESALGDPVDILLTEWARQCHKQDGLVVVPHFPDPRAEHAAAIVSGEVDAVEMTSWEDRYAGINPYSLMDWYRYLNCGYLVPAVGGTDKMSASTAVGTVRTYAHLQTDQPFTYSAWMEAVRRGDTFVTYGPLLEFFVDGQPMGTRISMPPKGGTVDIHWHTASVTVPMTRVELIVNGEVRESRSINSLEDHGSWSIPITNSCWLALLVRGGYPDQPEVITAHSSAVMVDIENSPLMAAADAVTILEQIEGSLAYLDTIGTRADDRAYKRMRLVLTAAHRKLHNRMHRQGHLHEHITGRDTKHPHSHPE